jgi:hypothetical protein
LEGVWVFHIKTDEERGQGLKNEALVGHAGNTVHGSVYLPRNALPMKLLKDGIEKLDFRVIG